MDPSLSHIGGVFLYELENQRDQSCRSVVTTDSNILVEPGSIDALVWKKYGSLKALEKLERAPAPFDKLITMREVVGHLQLSKNPMERGDLVYEVRVEEGKRKSYSLTEKPHFRVQLVQTYNVTQARDFIHNYWKASTKYDVNKEKKKVENRKKMDEIREVLRDLEQERDALRDDPGLNAVLFFQQT